MDTKEYKPKNAAGRYMRFLSILIKNAPTLFVIIVFIQLFYTENKNSNNDIFSNPNSFLIIGGIAVASFTIFLKYLESDKINDNSTDKLRDELYELKQILRNTSRNTLLEKEIVDELKTLQDKIAEKQAKGLELNETDKLKLFELFETKLEKNLSQEFLETIQLKFGAEILSSERYADLLRDLIELKERLRFEIKKLSLRANTNLAIGSITTLVAVVVLYMTVVTSNHPNFIDSVSLASYFVPRISLAIFIEVFAFFFLKLYKSNLDNIRYYHNEMTNIEMKVISLKSAIINSDKVTLTNVIKELSKTERNFLIKKGETTIELERLRSETSENKNIIDFAKSIIGKNIEKNK